MKKSKMLCVSLLCTFLMVTGCGNEADLASYQITRSADAFTISRQITVINTRSGEPLYEKQGLISVTISGDRLDIITKESGDTYKKDIVKLNQDTMYIIRDLEGVEAKTD